MIKRLAGDATSYTQAFGGKHVVLCIDGFDASNLEHHKLIPANVGGDNTSRVVILLTGAPSGLSPLVSGKVSGDGFISILGGSSFAEHLRHFETDVIAPVDLKHADAVELAKAMSAELKLNHLLVAENG